jgi:hypothetical protein
MIELMEALEITPCRWVHPDEERWAGCPCGNVALLYA